MRNAGSRRGQVHTRRRSYPNSVYVEGNTVRKLSVVPEERLADPYELEPKSRPGKRVRHMGFGYMMIMAACAMLTLWISASYLQLQAENTRSLKNIAALENELTELRTENRDEYNRLVSAVDLNEIRRVATEELGMVYAQPDQVIVYDGRTNDYVRQYSEVPQEEHSWLDSLLGSR